VNAERAPGGVHVMLDGSGFKSINDTHGHHAGDEAIKSMGGAIRSAVDDVVGPQHQDVWRVGGDEFAAHMPTHEHAARFLRTLRSKLDAIPHVGGTHRLAMQGGIGATPEDADKALYHAKDTKKQLGPLPGQAHSNFHSLMPGHEGAIPLDPELPVKPPELPKAPEMKAPELPKAT
jgi:diguanylate cyclase (GGDEF)-like protein